jgi:hypothetical protein
MPTETEGERWKVKLIVFVGGTCGSVHVQTFNNNLKELGVVESKRGAIMKGLVQELLKMVKEELHRVWQPEAESWWRR